MTVTPDSEEVEPTVTSPAAIEAPAPEAAEPTTMPAETASARSPSGKLDRRRIPAMWRADQKVTPQPAGRTGKRIHGAIFHHVRARRAGRR